MSVTIMLNPIYFSEFGKKVAANLIMTQILKKLNNDYF